MSPRLDKFLGKLREDDAPISDIDSVRTRVFDGVQQRSFHRRPSVYVLRIFGVAIAVVAIAGVTVASAQQAMPNDRLYPIKRITERAWLSLQMSTDSRLRVERTLIERRFVESRPDEYRDAITTAASHVDDATEREDPEVISAEAERFNDLIERQQAVADEDANVPLDADRDRMDDAYVEGLIRFMDAQVRSSEIREAKSVEPDGD